MGDRRERVKEGVSVIMWERVKEGAWVIGGKG